jgi:chaperonin GroEL|tara:strand:+ start:2069 stop:3700 length:1632 start_codon:yes stop_codon:yes gene_type:complete
MSKIIELGADAREKLVEGIDTLADAVISTLGPNGRNVVISKSHEPIKSTKDGVTVAKNINLKDPIKESGVQLVKQAAIQTADSAGDGTTTSTLLAREIIKKGLSSINRGVNAVEVKRGIDYATKKVVDCLKEKVAEDISSEEQLEQVATISANNDPEVGKLIASAIDKVGRDGIVHIEESKSGETYLETVEGMQFDRGYKSHFFVTDNSTMTCTLENPYILIADHKFSTVKDLLPILESVSTTNKSLLIIASDIDNEALATLIVNKARGTLKVAAVKAPEFGDRQKLVLEDIAILTGGQVFDKNKGMKLEKFSWDWFGEARTVTITKDQTTIVDGKGEVKSIDNRVGELQFQIENAASPFEIEKLQDRLGRMVGGVSIIHVGGYNETEMHEKKDRVDDALNATKAALEEGIVPGGGAALIYASEALNHKDSSLSQDFCLGIDLVKQACYKPLEQILFNAGYGPSVIYETINTILDSDDTWTGFDLKNESYIDMRKSGIIDPTKVTRTALENASSVAGTVLLTECVVVEEPSEEEATPNYNGMF